MAGTFYDALNAANLNALRMLDTLLKALDDRNPVPSFLNTINERIRMQLALNAGKERQDYYNQLKSGLYGKKGVTQQLIQLGEGIGFNENGQYKIPAQLTFNPYGVDLSGLGGNEGNTISVSALNGVQNIQTPKQNSWGSLFNQSFNQPPTDNPLAQAVEGQGTSPNYMSLMSNGLITPQQQLAFDEKMNLRRWLEWDAQNNGVTNPLVSLDRYNMFMQPMRQQAETDELRNAYFILNDPNASDAQRLNAVSLIEYYKQNPYMEEEYNYKIGNKPNPQFNGDIDSEYGGEDANGAAIYSYLKQKGMPDEVIAGIMGNLQQESRFNPAAIGDSGNSIGIAQWYKERGDALRNFAQQRGKDWSDLTTQLDFLVDEINNGYPDLIKGMTGLTPHDSALKFHTDYERSNDTPEMAAGRGHNATKIYNSRKTKPRYIKDNSRMTNKEMAEYKYAMQNALSDKKFQQQVALAEYKENLKRSRPDNRRSSNSSSNSKNNKGSSSLHSALENLAEVSNEFNPEMDMNSKDGQNYKKKYDGAFQDVKNKLNETYPGLGEYIKKQVQQGKSSEDICMEISGAIKQDINTNLPDSKIADVVEELMLDYDNRVKRRQVAPNVAKRMSQKSHTSFTDKQGRGGSIYLGEPEFNRYAGMTDEDIRTQNADRTYDGYARSISSQARLLGNKEFEEGKTKTLRQKHDAMVDRDKKRRE